MGVDTQPFGSLPRTFRVLSAKDLAAQLVPSALASFSIHPTRPTRLLAREPESILYRKTLPEDRARFVLSRSFCEPNAKLLTHQGTCPMLPA